MIPLACLRRLALDLTRWPVLLGFLLLLSWVTGGYGMTDDTISTLRQDTRNLFYHGYNNYMTHAFPEDELKPLSCHPQTRNRDNPADIGLNDVLGNYSLTLIDSLSTLAILASGEERDGRNALRDFQGGVKTLVELYGDGSDGSCGSRACGFDLDSKVQVFETNIRGVGGLLSAHLFAVGELPVKGYEPKWIATNDGKQAIRWPNFEYDGQLLRLAHDLATRLLPAFGTSTDLPYPRVNLRHGIPFYRDAEEGVCRLDGTSSDPREITETCAAGAGSLVLEFTTLSRLTGDSRFEELATKAFWAVWKHRSPIGLIAGGIDAETAQWTVPALAGIGAGIDSFFEYALKSHILLSAIPSNGPSIGTDAFLQTWQASHAALKNHVYRSNATEKHPYYAQSDSVTGAPRYSWVDNLSAYYPGLLTLAGELDEAIESHLLFSALWTRYSALPERWHINPGGQNFIDPNFKHWAGRPEFIESTYYLYQATKDPWYLHVGEMALRDIRRRCWTKCGWTDLADVVSGEQRDRMESFFLGETAKYLYLLFEPEHPLNKVDAAVVFTTEGHPLVIPKSHRRTGQAVKPAKTVTTPPVHVSADPATCPAPPSALPFTVSNVAARHDLFHAAALADLHLVPINPARSSPLLEGSAYSAGISLLDIRSPTNYTFYPWTLPQSLIPAKGMSSRIREPVLSTLTFPDMSGGDGAPGGGQKGGIPLGALQKVLQGVLINSLSNVRLSMIQESRAMVLPAPFFDSDGISQANKEFRVNGIANLALGKNEKVLLSPEAVKGLSSGDPHFTRVKDLEGIDLVVDVPGPDTPEAGEGDNEDGGNDIENVIGEWEIELPSTGENGSLEGMWEDLESMVKGLLASSGISLNLPNDLLPSVLQHDTTPTAKAASQPTSTPTTTPALTRHLMPAILPTGPGTAPLPAAMDNQDPMALGLGSLPFQKILFLDSTLCSHNLPIEIAKGFSVLVIKRGECSFSDKLANIPSFAPDEGRSLQLVVVLSTSGDSGAGNAGLTRPLLDKPQLTPSGLERRHPIALCLVDGGDTTVDTFRRLATGFGKFEKGGRFVKEISPGDGSGAGLAVKRRYWFESMGVPIGNLIVL